MAACWLPFAGQRVGHRPATRDPVHVWRSAGSPLTRPLDPAVCLLTHQICTGDDRRRSPLFSFRLGSFATAGWSERGSHQHAQRGWQGDSRGGQQCRKRSRGQKKPSSQTVYSRSAFASPSKMPGVATAFNNNAQSSARCRRLRLSLFALASLLRDPCPDSVPPPTHRAQTQLCL